MSSTFKATLNLDLLLTEIVSSGLMNGPLAPRFLEQLNMMTGTSDGQVNVGYYKRESGIANTTTTYDLIGSLKDNSQTTINFDEVVLIAIKNLSTTAANYLTIGPDATNGFGAISANKGFWSAALGSGGGTVVTADGGSWTVFHAYTGVPATAGTGDKLSVITTGTSLNTWDIIIIGRDN